VVKFSWNAVPQPISGIPPPEIAIPPPKVAPPPGQLMFGKIITIVATRSQILRLKYINFYFGLSFTPYLTGGARRLQRSPNLLAGFKGAYF